MNHKVGIWIDHKKAVIVSDSAAGVTARLGTESGPHVMIQAGRGQTSTADGGGGEKKYEHVRPAP